MNYTSENAVCILCYLFAYGVVTCHGTDESSDESKSCDKDKKSSLSPEVSALYEMVERMRQQVMRLEDRQRQLESMYISLVIDQDNYINIRTYGYRDERRNKRTHGVLSMHCYTYVYNCMYAYIHA